ncbi:MAG TPA: hypothetical protein VJ983_09415 [candidate division Zixibacteria bacterium]|nr:hypothetical protein [candidate division Zixibacteria bacterium]
MRRALVLSLGVLLLASSCHKNSTGSQPVVVDYRGTYGIKKTGVVGEKKDSVLMEITDNSKFSCSFYPVSSQDAADYCDCQGSVYNFGTNVITFNTTNIITGNCDSSRYPQGQFSADFISHGDTIIFVRSTTDTTFTFKLFKQ